MGNTKTTMKAPIISPLEYKGRSEAYERFRLESSGVVPSRTTFLDVTVGAQVLLEFCQSIFPSFVEIDGITTYDDGLGESSNFDRVSKWTKNKSIPKFDIEKVLNHRHLLDCYQSVDLLSDDALNAFAQAHLLALQTSLDRSFPKRVFKVAFVDDEYTLSFWSADEPTI